MEENTETKPKGDAEEEKTHSSESHEVKKSHKHSDSHVKRDHKTSTRSKTESEGFWQDTGVWRFAAVLLVILLVASIFTSGFKFGGSGNSLSLDDATDAVIQFINSNLLQPGSSLIVEGSTDAGDLYQLDLSVDGQPVSIYVSKGGQFFIPQAVAMDEALDAPPVPTRPSQPTAPTRVDVSADDDPVKGDADAPVTIIEFSDFQCPFCSRFYTDALPQIEQEYINTGKVKLVYRDFPLESIHPQARPAAEAAECADDQGKFWEFHDLLFENQQLLSDASYKQWASDLGLDENVFADCVDSNKHADEVTGDLDDGAAGGVTGTPAFFVNGQLLSGAQPFSAFQVAIEAAMNAGNEITGGVVADVEAAAPEVEIVENVAIRAKKFRFEPSEVTVTLGSTVELAVSSLDVDFGFSLPAYDVELEMVSEETVRTSFVADQAGRYAFSCSNCGGKESVMKGFIIVE
jgi:protein-disulfide isomerase/plastocyanin